MCVPRPSRAHVLPALSSVVSGRNPPVRLSNGIGEGERPLKRSEEVTLSREDGEALIARLEADALTAEDRRVLVKVLTFYFWLLFALREAKLSLKRLKALVFGERSEEHT